ncbi:Asparagine synthetase domain-containing protein 1 [Dictyocoela muelleri]|nr:Asparagine synthetase domain-containing protein 1 [Dictyocoela muelleri]
MFYDDKGINNGTNNGESNNNKGNNINNGNNNDNNFYNSFSKDSWDRKLSKKFYSLIKNKSKKFKLLENDIGFSQIDLKLIKELIYPKKSIMDFNIGLCHFYTSKRAHEYFDNKDNKEYNNDYNKDNHKLAFLGSGSDELFGGYSLYKRKKNYREIMKNDYKNMWNRNFGRDDRVISCFGVDGVYPFMDDEVVNFAQSLKDELIFQRFKDEDKNFKEEDLKDDKDDNSENVKILSDKFILRLLLVFLGYEEFAFVKKKAIQFGSGVFKLEKKFKDKEI